MAVEFRTEGAVGWITLNRPEKLNAMTNAMTQQLQELAAQVNQDDSLRVLVLTGSGKAFCVGSDINELSELESIVDYHKRMEYADILRAIEKPVIAAINGYALGGGLEMALACDIRIAADTATFGAPEINLGWVGRGGVTQILPRLVGLGRASWLIFTGDRIDAKEALSIGLVEAVYPAAELLSRARELAARIAEKSPFALRMGKRALKAALNMPLDAGLQYERELVTVCFGTEDKAEGIRAFKERRSPVFRGR